MSAPGWPARSPPVALRSLLSLRPLHTSEGFPAWAAAVLVIASAEELFLRGALYDAVERWRGPGSAVVVGSLCFAVLHVPLYGWRVIPLDLAVGVVLGGLRHGTGSPAAPVIAHIGADFAGWFLR